MKTDGRTNSLSIGVLHLIDSAGIAGGQRYLLDLITHADPAWAHHVILVQPGPFEGLLRDQSCRYLVLPIRRRFSFSVLSKIREYIRAHKIRIVHSHGYRSNILGRLASAMTPAAHIATVHVSLYDYLDTPSLIRRLYLLIERATSFMTTRYVCISRAMRDDLLRMGIPREKMLVIHNGVDLGVFHARTPDEGLTQELGIQGHRPVIGTVGRMVAEKNQGDLMEAVYLLRERWPQLRCLFIGEGPLLPELRRRAEALGVADQCLFPGVRSDIAAIYPLLDLFILPARREPFGLVLLEAMASMVPVIATAAGGPPDFIESGRNGVLVPPANPGELSAQIDRLLSDPDRARTIAHQGYDTVHRAFGIEGTVKRIHDLYRSLTALPHCREDGFR